jgi:hypothetical protein
MKKKFIEGQTVRIKRFKRRPSHWCADGGMDYLMGKEPKISMIDYTDDVAPFLIEDINYPYRRWWMKYSDFDLIDSPQEPTLNIIL